MKPWSWEESHGRAGDGARDPTPSPPLDEACTVQQFSTGGFNHFAAAVAVANSVPFD